MKYRLLRDLRGFEVALTLVASGCASTQSQVIEIPKRPMGMGQFSLEPVTNDPDDERSLRISPDGRFLLFNVMTGTKPGRRGMMDAMLGRQQSPEDVLQSFYEQNSISLIEIGKPAIEPTLPFLLSDCAETRLHAERILTHVLAGMRGFVPGQGWSSADGERTYRDFSATLWDSDAIGRQIHETTIEHRLTYIARVKRWLSHLRS